MNKLCIQLRFLRGFVRKKRNTGLRLIQWGLNESDVAWVVQEISNNFFFYSSCTGFPFYSRVLQEITIPKYPKIILQTEITCYPWFFHNVFITWKVKNANIMTQKIEFRQHVFFSLLVTTTVSFTDSAEAVEKNKRIILFVITMISL